MLKHKHKLADYLSYIFSPATVLPASFFLVIFKQNFSLTQILQLVIQFILLGMIPVVLIYRHLKSAKKITSMDMQNRQERPLFNLLVSFPFTVLLICLYFFAPKIIFGFGLIVYVWFIIQAFITLFWKISGHSGAVTISSIIVIYYYIWLLIPMLILIALVSWSRIHRKNHTLSQVLGGIGLALSVSVLIKKFFIL